MKWKLNLIVLRIRHTLKSESGQDLIEYALLLGFLSLAVISAIKPLGGVMEGYYLYLHQHLHAALSQFF